MADEKVWKRGDRVVGADGRHGMVRARVLTLPDQTVRTLVFWDDATSSQVDPESLTASIERGRV